MDVKQYKEVIKDFKSGKLKGYTLVFDNDDGYWSKLNRDYDSESENDDLEELAKKYGLPSGYEDLVKLAVASGIDAEWA